MSLNLLPDLTFPITQRQVDPLMDNMVQLNLLDGCLSERGQRALNLCFHIYETWCKTGGKVDYRSKDGHRRLIQDAMTFCGTGNSIGTRYGDLSAAHLGIDYHNAQMRLKEAGHLPLSSNVSNLIGMCPDLAEFSPEWEKRAQLLMTMLGKRALS
jgi:hypothetical protein